MSVFQPNIFQHNVFQVTTAGLGGKLSSYVLDNGLQAIDALADKIFVCSQEPATYSEATTTYALGSKDFGSAGGAIDGTMADATPSGRKIITNAITGGNILAAGTVTAWALVDSTNSRLLASGNVTSLAVTSGTFNMNAITITEPASS
jgi:hypothetical protein